MGTVLVALFSDEADDELLRVAKDHVTGTSKDLLVCRVLDSDQYQHDVQRHAKSGRDVESIDELEAAAESEADEIADAAFDDDVPYTALGIVGTVPDDVIRVAEERDCEHVFVTGKKRSPTGKAIFGDHAQSVILQFDGPVTITTAS